MMNTTNIRSLFPRRGLAVTEVLVSLALGAFLSGLLLQTTITAKERNARVQCQHNLKQIGLAAILYANENRGMYPRTSYVAADKIIPDLTNAGFDSHDPFRADTTVPANCVPSALFLLIRTTDISPAVFNCPATTAAPDDFGGAPNKPTDRSNFTELKRNLSYSYANPYPDNAAAKAGFKLVNSLNEQFALAADINPGTANGSDVLSVTVNSAPEDMRKANSKNHGQDGQNVLFADGHVEFNTSLFVGVDRDNIYCRGIGGPHADKADVVNSPKDENDSVLLPTAAE